MGRGVNGFAGLCKTDSPSCRNKGSSRQPQPFLDLVKFSFNMFRLKYKQPSSGCKVPKRSDVRYCILSIYMYKVHISTYRII